MNQQASLIEATIRGDLGHLSASGALVVRSGRYTGRAAKERYIVERPENQSKINWGKTNQPIGLEFASDFFSRLQGTLSCSEIYRFEGSIAGHPLEVISTCPWHIAFCQNMFRASEAAPAPPRLQGKGKLTILHDPWGQVSDLGLSFASESLVVLDPVAMRIAIVGSGYAGEIKKSAFSLLNCLFPESGILPLHASATCLADGSGGCLLFGLSGTGKTTLSAAPDRLLVGDDEIVWSDRGISNLEGGCYAKMIDLTEDSEPLIFRAANRFGSIMENVALDRDTGQPDLTDRHVTENTRCAYPLGAYARAYRQDIEAQAPQRIVFLTADAMGALPAVARLDTWQAQYHFLSGYTSKIGGTEMGIKHPTATFSPCFGEPFMPLHPSRYSQLLERLTARSKTEVWLLNTGWTGGAYGQGKRFPLPVSRAILSQIQSGALATAPTIEHPVFRFGMPTSCEGVDEQYLRVPDGPQVSELAREFEKNSDRFADETDPRVIELGGPLGHIPVSMSVAPAGRSSHVA